MKETYLKSKESGSTILHRSIFYFYERGLKYVPVILMFCHWQGVFNFHSNPREIILDIDGNLPCIIYLYTMTYIFPLLFMTPASYFFKLCWVYRIPFAYIVGINLVRLYYGSWLIKNEMYAADTLLIFIIAQVYHTIPQLSLAPTYLIYKLNCYEDSQPTC